MNGKVFIRINHWINIIGSIIIFICITACTSNPGRGLSSDILEYQRKIDALETRNNLYESAIRNCIIELESIGESAGNAETAIDAAIRELDAYQRAIEQLLRYYRAATYEINNVDQNSNNINSNSSD